MYERGIGSVVSRSRVAVGDSDHSGGKRGDVAGGVRVGVRTASSESSANTGVMVCPSRNEQAQR